MSKQDIVREVVKIILKYAKPTRIYLYGSQLEDDATKASDIDIAYDDGKFKENYKIEEEIEKIQTLVKIDVKNIAFADDRFKNRVKATGRVLFSANKELRAEDGLYNFSKAYDRFADAVDRRDEFYKHGYSDIYLDLVVKRFEFTFEMSWKAIKRYLAFVGIECLNPRSCFKEAFAQGLIEDEGVWLDMVEKRNLSSHIYDENEIGMILDLLIDYKNAFERLKNNLEIRIQKQQKIEST